MKPNLLIVDENKEIDLLGEEFIALGNDVSIMHRYDEVLDNFLENSPDLIIMNFSNPKIAMRITRSIIELDHTACVIAMTKSNDPLIRREAFSAGARALINYPRTPKDKTEVSETINSIFKTCQLLQEEDCKACWECNLFTDVTTIEKP